MKQLQFLFLLSLLTFLFHHEISAQTQLEMDEAAYKNYQLADKELNNVYNELKNGLTEAEKKLLVTAQKNWLKFRDTHCEFEIKEYEGGSIQGMIRSNCLKELTEERTKRLKELLKHN